jgi:hypothetical protein
LLVATTIAAAGRSSFAKKSRCQARSCGHGPRSQRTGSYGTPSASRNSKYWSCTCCIGRGGIFAFVNSQLKSRARARSKPSFTAAGTKLVMTPALK